MSIHIHIHIYIVIHYQGRQGVQDWLVVQTCSKKIAWVPHARMESKHFGKLRTSATLQRLLEGGANTPNTLEVYLCCQGPEQAPTGLHQSKS